MNSLKIIDISKSILPLENLKYFVENLNEIELLKSEYFVLCCYKKLFKNNTICLPSKYILTDCSNLIGSKIVLLLISILLSISFFTNIWSLSYFVYNRREKNIIFNITSLIYDCFSLVYLAVIVTKTVEFNNNFFNNYDLWLNSFLCPTIEFLLHFSLFTSNTNVIFLIVERYLFYSKSMNFTLKIYVYLITINVIFSSIVASILTFKSNVKFFFLSFKNLTIFISSFFFQHEIKNRNRI